MTCGLILSCARWQHSWPVRRGALAPCHPTLDSEGGWSLVDPGTLYIPLYIRRQCRHNDGAYPITKARMPKLVSEREQLGAGALLV